MKVIKLIAVLVFAGVGVQVEAMQMSLEKKLEYAAQLNDYAQVKDLLERGAKPARAQDVLWFAAIHGNEKMAKLLIEYGASLEELNTVTAGKSVLMHAAAKGDNNMVRFLIENGADLNAGTAGFDSTALMYAAELKDNGAVVRTLLTTIPLNERAKILKARASIITGELSLKHGDYASKDIRKFITQKIIDQLVDEQLARVEKLVAAKDVDGNTARNDALRMENQTIADLLDLNNPETIAWLRHELEKNIRKILFARPAASAEALREGWKPKPEKPHSNLEEQTVVEEDPFGGF